MSRGAAVANASRSGFADGTGFCVDRGTSGAVPVWQADRELSGTGAVGGVERGPATVGTHHQAGQLVVAFSAGGSGAGDGAQRSGVAQQVFSPGDAARTKDREDRHGAKTGDSFVLDVA